MDHFQTEPQQIGISLFDSPKLNFSDGLLEISYNNNTLSFKEDFIYNFSYSSEPATSAIRTPKVTKKLSIELKENTIMLRDLLPDTRLYAYTLEGKVVKKSPLIHKALQMSHYQVVFTLLKFKNNNLKFPSNEKNSFYNIFVCHFR